MKTVLGISALSILLMSSTAFADERALQQALAKAQFMLKQATAEKMTAQQDLEQLKAEFEKYKKKSSADIEAQKEGAVKLAGNVNLMKERYMELVDKYKELQGSLKLAVRTAKTNELLLDGEKKKFQLCFDNNKKMYDINQEILGNYQDKGVWEVLEEKEPFTGFASVKMEEFIQDYQYKTEDLKLDDTLLGVTDLDKQ